MTYPQSVRRIAIASAFACAALAGCATTDNAVAAEGPKGATSATRAANAALLTELPFGDKTAFALAHKGFIAPLPTAEIKGKAGNLIWNPAQYDFIKEGAAAPDTVNPSLWRQSQLINISGLFEVTDGIYQIRNQDLSNMTIIEGETGITVVDPMISAETAKVGLDLYFQHRPKKPVVAVIYTHSHVDHYGGILGVTSEQAVAAGNVRIIAPDGFLEQAIDENVMAGPAMVRRAAFQFGPLLPKGPRAQVDAGLGKGIPKAPPALLAPTETIFDTGTELVVDGIRIVFQNTPDAEAPSEMNFHFPDKRLLCMAENCTHTLHNLYPIRGAQVRDALAWSKYINEALYLYGNERDISFASHHWPRFGRDDVRVFLERQRDVYRWLNDQTMRLANQGHTAIEIAEQLELPACFSRESDVQGYYGTVSHNVKSVYARYLGWYDANPANLQPLPPEDAGRNYVEFMGGADEVLRRARESFDRGEYRWVAQVVNHVVFADPKNQAARALQADALEQLGYQAESATWRNAYLNGAQELRNGVPPIPLGVGQRSFEAMPIEKLFDVLGVRFDPNRFSGAGGLIGFHFSDLEEDHVLGITEAAIHHLPNRTSDATTLTAVVTRGALGRLISKADTLDEAIAQNQLTLDGDASLLERLLDALEGTGMFFGVVEP